MLPQDCPRFPGLPAYVRLVAGASITAASVIKEGSADISICWDGGRFDRGFSSAVTQALTSWQFQPQTPRAKVSGSWILLRSRLCPLHSST